ncbi:hypothetical protein [Vagococcus salmoninarum]|uniref:hypothetical protein n=1 Tax=Vagococcus salmoninarum TaxID=2739 RepID=UPI003F994EE3
MTGYKDTKKEVEIMKNEVKGFSVVTEKNELIANIDLESGEIIYIDGYKVISHTKEEPALFTRTGSDDKN